MIHFLLFPTSTGRLHSGILCLTKIVTAFLNLIWYLTSSATYEPAVYLQLTCQQTTAAVSGCFCFSSLFPSKCFVQFVAEHKELDWFYILNEQDRVCVGRVHEHVHGGSWLTRPDAPTTSYQSSSPGYCCGMIISENAVSSSTSGCYKKRK